MLTKVQVGESVIFHNANGKTHNALVTTAWIDVCVNVVIVSDEESKHDQYGRQIERYTSLLHKSCQPVHGECIGVLRANSQTPTRHLMMCKL